VQLPFSIEEFLGVFRAYNLAVWPAQIGLYLLGIALIFAALRGSGAWRRWSVASALALLWGWMGAVYHLTFFAEINPAARLFGIMFLVQAVLWIAWAWREPSMSFWPADDTLRFTGAGLLAYAFVIYPLLNFAFGHGYPAMPTFGLPCPTTIATFGILAWAKPRPPWYIWLIPVAWAVIGTSAAFTLGIHEDLGLLAAAVLTIAMHMRSEWRRERL
jgi:hypothetical protein